MEENEREQINSVIGDKSATGLLIMQNKLEEAVKESPAEYFFMYQYKDIWKTIHSKVYKGKEELLKDLGNLFKSTDLSKDGCPEIYELRQTALLNYYNTDSLNTNLSLLKKVKDSATITLYLEGFGYVLQGRASQDDRVETVTELIRKLSSENPHNGNLIYPTTGDAEEGTLRFSSEVSVYKAVSKLE